SNNPISLVDPSGLVVSAEAWAAVEAATAAARAASALVSPLAYDVGPPLAPPGPVWSPQVAADPLARTMYGNLNYSQYAAQVERAAAQQAQRAAIQAGLRSAARMGLYAVLGYEVFVIGNVSMQAARMFDTGQFSSCTPGIPDSLQACDNPGSNVIEKV